METLKHMRCEARRSGSQHAGRLLPHGHGRCYCRELQPERGSPSQRESMRRQGEYCRISSTKLWALQ